MTSRTTSGSAADVKTIPGSAAGDFTVDPGGVEPPAAGFGGQRPQSLGGQASYLLTGLGMISVDLLLVLLSHPGFKGVFSPDDQPLVFGVPGFNFSVTDAQGNQLQFDPAGNLVRHWGAPGAGYEWPPSMHGITIDGKDNVWLAGNAGHTVLKFSKDGKFLLQMRRQLPESQRGGPEEVLDELQARIDSMQQMYATYTRALEVLDTLLVGRKVRWERALRGRIEDPFTPL